MVEGLQATMIGVAVGAGVEVHVPYSSPPATYTGPHGSAHPDTGLQTTMIGVVVGAGVEPTDCLACPEDEGTTLGNELPLFPLQPAKSTAVLINVAILRMCNMYCLTVKDAWKTTNNTSLQQQAHKMADFHA
jgi:hypothetical protein